MAFIGSDLHMKKLLIIAGSLALCACATHSHSDISTSEFIVQQAQRVNARAPSTDASGIRTDGAKANGDELYLYYTMTHFSGEDVNIFFSHPSESTSMLNTFCNEPEIEEDLDMQAQVTIAVSGHDGKVGHIFDVNTNTCNETASDLAASR